MCTCVCTRTYARVCVSVRLEDEVSLFTECFSLSLADLTNQASLARQLAPGTGFAFQVLRSQVHSHSCLAFMLTPGV